MLRKPSKKCFFFFKTNYYLDTEKAIRDYLFGIRKSFKTLYYYTIIHINLVNFENKNTLKQAL